MQQWYNCPRCRRVVKYGINTCPNCKCSLAWSQEGPIPYIPAIDTSQQAGQSPAPQQQAVQTASIPSPKKTKKPLVIILSIIGGCVLLFSTFAICMSKPSTQYSPSASTSTPTYTPPSTDNTTASAYASSSTDLPSGRIFTSAEIEYADRLANINAQLGETTSTMSPLIKNPKLYDEYWRVTLAGQLAAIHVLYQRFSVITPPQSMLPIHNEYLQAMQHYDVSVDLITEGIDKLDDTLLGQASTEWSKGNDCLHEAQKLLENFVSSSTTQEPLSTESENDQSFKIYEPGTTAKLKWGNRPVEWLAIDEGALAKLMDAEIAIDYMGIAAMLKSGNVFEVPRNTSVLIIDEDYVGACKVKVMDGPYLGRIGWTIAEHLYAQ